jgi:hypothetical protein
MQESGEPDDSSLWVANSCSRSDWQLEILFAMGLELLIVDHFPVMTPP